MISCNDYDKSEKKKECELRASDDDGGYPRDPQLNHHH